MTYDYTPPSVWLMYATKEQERCYRNWETVRLVAVYTGNILTAKRFYERIHRLKLKLLRFN